MWNTATEAQESSSYTWLATKVATANYKRDEWLPGLAQSQQKVEPIKLKVLVQKKTQRYARDVRFHWTEKSQYVFCYCDKQQLNQSYKMLPAAVVKESLESGFRIACQCVLKPPVAEDFLCQLITEPSYRPGTMHMVATTPCRRIQNASRLNTSRALF